MSSEIKVRRAEKRDIPRVLELLTQVCMVHHKGRPDIFKADSQKYHAEELELLCEDETRPVFVGVDEHDRVLGYGFCVLVDYSGSNVQVERTELYLDDLCVDESVRGTDVATRIFEHVKSESVLLGCDYITLNVWGGNIAAQKFYEKMGMKPRKTMMEIRV